MFKFKAVVALATFAAAAAVGIVGTAGTVGSGVLTSMAPGAVGSPRATAPAPTATPVRAAVVRPAVAQPVVGRPAAVIPVRKGNDQWMWIVPVGADSEPSAPEGAADILVEV
ncbi:hypothetical protein ACFVH0_07690 [Streptomyces sp. NPDC127117]|uniref:hypothetical protein n=1 Tax=Streptomyces sp. NPDC127117 TaxID=3345368 RepID=UPI00363C6986